MREGKAQNQNECRKKGTLWNTTLFREVVNMMVDFIDFSDKNIKINKAVEIDQSLRNKIQNLENDIDNYEKDLSDVEKQRDEFKADTVKMGSEIDLLMGEKKELAKKLEESQNALEKATKELGKMKSILYTRFSIGRTSVNKYPI